MNSKPTQKLDKSLDTTTSQVQHLKIIQLLLKQTIMTATIICGESSAYLSLKSILQFIKSIWLNQCRTTIVLASKHLTTRLVSFVLLCVHLHQLLFIENDKSYQLGPKPSRLRADDELRSNLVTSRQLLNSKSNLTRNYNSNTINPEF